jgi:hypothetical protein
VGRRPRPRPRRRQPLSRASRRMAFSNGSLERSLVMRARVQDCRLSGLGRTRLCWAGRLAVTLFIALPITSLLFSWILGPVAIWILVDRELLVPIEAPECRCSSRACVAYRTTSVRNLPCQFAFCRAEHFYATGAVETNRVGSIEVKLVPLMIFVGPGACTSLAGAAKLRSQPRRLRAEAPRHEHDGGCATFRAESYE